MTATTAPTLPSYLPEPTRCRGWGHRSCLGHYVQPQPGEIVHLAGENFERVSAEPGWFGMGYVRNDGRLSEITTTSGEAFLVTGYHDGTGQLVHGEWQAVILADAAPQPLPFPMPGTALYGDGRTVIASCPYIDDERGDVALVLLLNRSAPFFTVAHVALTAFDPSANPDIPAPHGAAYERGEVDELGTFENIVPAVREYEQSGGAA